MTEAEFEQAVVDLAHVFGWKIAGFRPARTTRGWRTPVKWDGTGWPDLTLVHAKRALILFVELKTVRGKLSDEQLDWMTTLNQACRMSMDVRFHVWRPSDSNDIARALSNGKLTEWRLTA